MAVKLSPVFNGQEVDANGDPAVGYKLFTYAAGSSTKQTTYTDSDGLVPQTNPIILNSLGYPTNGPIWLTAGQNYKFVLAPSTDADPPTSPIKTIDGVTGVNDSATSVTQFQSSGVTPTYISSTSFSLVGDQTSDFHLGRRVKATVNSGVVYGAIATTAYTSITTVTLTMDGSQTLDSGLSAIDLSLLRADHLATPFANVAETIAGVKTFTSSPVVPDATAANEAASFGQISAAGNAPYPPKHIDGLTWVNNVTDSNNDIDLQVGHCRDSANAFNMTLATVMTKRLDAAWAAGTNQGGLFSGTKAISTWYHVHLIRKDGDGSIDAGFDTSLTAANKPSGYGSYRHIASVLTDASGNIVGFKAMEISGGGLRVDFNNAQSDYTTTVLGLTPVAMAMKVPLGIEVEAHLGFGVAQSNTAVSTDIYYPGKTAQTADITQGRSLSTNASATGSANAGKITVRTNTSSQVMAVCDDAGTTINVATYGYTWGRR